MQLRQEVAALRKRNARLESQNESMRQGMRRCLTCEYRLDVKSRQGNAPVLDKGGAGHKQA
ncbi:hypothetical protein [Candidatus Marimicrobium litorale]|uniref:Transposase n=1 Tax=Candidatus Marimicrobium litorale TaxID=2518991 RepID=A0ABT3T3C0_9GAMM|nr:hypothetical protein [Candidatus Marimicrobium litorale]MCX2976767.1 hypothetical protein [Candidatus Marimicrobium litorale]